MTKIVYTVTDGGHHGITTCGFCSYLLDENDTKICPNCKSVFEGYIFEPYPFGGSDFD